MISIQVRVILGTEISGAPNIGASHNDWSADGAEGGLCESIRGDFPRTHKGEILLSCLVTIINQLGGDRIDNEGILFSNLQNLLFKPLLVDCQATHGILMLICGYFFSSIPIAKSERNFQSSPGGAPSPARARIYVWLFMESFMISSAEIIELMVETITE
jgi:hypothetical protein